MTVRTRLAVLLSAVVLTASLLPAIPAVADDAPTPSATPVDGSSAPSIATDPEPLLTFPAIANPTISKSTGIPPKLTASVDLTAAPGATVKWVWLRDGHAISGATSASYTVTVSDAAHTLAARATITKSGYSPKVVTSDGYTDFSLVLSPSFTITGGNHVGEIFVVSPLEFTKPGGGAIDLSTTTYQWRRNGVAIPGATDDQYQATGADAGKVISVLIVATTPGYLAFSFAPITDSPGKAEFVVHAAPGISGPVGRLLTVSGLDDAIEDPYPLLGSPYTLTYQWKRNSVNIPGATHETYLLTSADVGTETSVVVSVHKLGYEDASTDASGYFTMMPNTALAVTQTNGPPHIGTTLSVLNPGFSANSTPLDPDLTYRWMRDGVTIAGASATSGSYVISAGDLGHVISVRVTAHEFSGNYPDYVWTRDATLKIGIFAFAPSGSATVSATGSPATLAVTNLGVVDVGGMKVAYQWMRNSAPISGATKSTYKLTPADVGTYTYVRLTFTAPSYTPYGTSSASTSYTLSDSGAPGISPSGTPKVGDTLTAVVPNYTTPGGSMPTPSKVFQWLRNGVAVSGETNATYIVRSADKGAKISLRIVASWPGLNQAIGTSAPTPAVASGVLQVVPNQPTVTVGATSLVADLPLGTLITPQTTLKYQWYRGGKAVSGATKRTYVLSSADKNKTVNVRVTVTKANVLPTSAVLPLSTPIDYDITVSSPSENLIPIFGNGKVGGLVYVSSSPANWSFVYVGSGATASVTKTTYYWYRQTGPTGTPVAITSDAFSPSYIQVAADWNKYLRVKLVVSGPGIVPYSVFSGPAGPVQPGVNTNDGTAVATMNPATDTLTASLQSLAPAKPAPVLTYQWWRKNGSGPAPIAGATGKTYKISFLDYDASVWVKITVKRDKFDPAPDSGNQNDAQYTLESALTSYTLHAGTSSPAFSSYPVFGVPISAAMSYYDKPDGTSATGARKLIFQWFRSNTANFADVNAHVVVLPFTGQVYTPVAADIDKFLGVNVIAKYPGWVEAMGTFGVSSRVDPASLGANATLPLVAKSNGAPPTLTAILSSANFTVKPTSFTYQWMRQAAPNLAPEHINGATKSTYTLTSADWKHLIFVEVTAHKSGYADVEKSTPGVDYSITVNNVDIDVDGGTAFLGTHLTALYLGTTPGVSSTMTYQWYRQTGTATPVAISGATKLTYTVTAADLDKNLFARLRPIAPGYVASSTQYTPSVLVNRLSYGGSFSVDTLEFPTGGVYRAVVHNSLTTPGVKITYQWYREGVKIAGATSTSYKPPASQLQGHWQFRATLSKTGYYTITFSQGYTNT